MRFTTRGVVIASVLAALTGSARADAVTDWIERAAAAGYRAGVLTPMNARNVALVAVAMFEALNSITPRYTPYRVHAPANAGTSPDAAAAAAAHYLLIRAYPDQAKDLDAAFQTALAVVPDGPSKSDGIRLGEHVAAILFDERKSDGAEAPNAYRPVTTAGVYVPTVLPIAPSWGSVKPFGLRTGRQFRPQAPYALTSAEWAREYDEVKRMGAKIGSERSAEQTQIARFWEFTGPNTYMPVVRQIAAAKRLGMLETARLVALVAMTAADAVIAVFDAKYTYNFWRPVTAIRNGDLDGNDATARDPAWESFIPTPLHPEYPCAHCIAQGGAASVLEAFFGDTVPTFSLTSPTAPGVTRSFVRLSDYVAEVINARIYDGVHYRTSGNVGAAMGRQIAAYIVQDALTPVH